MPGRIIESYDVKRIDILNEKGDADESLLPHLTDKDIKYIYELLVLSRAFDQRALNL